MYNLSRKDASFALVCTTACLLLWKVMAQKNELAEEELAKKRLEREVRSERKGRTKAEQRLRKLTQQASLQTSALRPVPVVVGGKIGSPAAPAATEASGTLFRPIGFVRSPFDKRCGTPRQSGLCASARSTLELLPVVNPSSSLDGIEKFSHLWVLFVFHENTNSTKEQRIVDARKGDTSKAPPFQGLLTKISPPRSNLKVGVFSCRSPHRPNPIGLSLAKVVEVNKGTIVLEGLDVLEGTPVLDIKPYLPQFDSIPDATVPQWVRNSYSVPSMPVEWSEAARSELDALDIPLAPFESKESLCAAIEETLSLDIRSPLQKKKHEMQAVAQVFFEGDLHFHKLRITYSLMQVREREDQCLEEVSSVIITSVTQS